ncbi:MAG: cytochrome c3 family protein [Deltaproteobacteria bacterium]|nr:cytochrome c3 family protein [Deltaproteobacteria bacterium]
MLKRVFLFAVAQMLLFSAAATAAETKDIRFTFKSADPVVFSHEFHLSKYNHNCKICHDAIFNLRSRKRFTMAEMERTKSCGACHSGIKAFSVASEKECVKCHKGKPREVTYRIKGLGEAVFSHAIHTAKTGGACKSCHNGKVITGKEKGVTMAEMEKGRTCGSCHNGKKVFAVTANCDRCHKGLKPKDITFALKGVTPATFSHSFHTQAYSCKDCHTKTFPYKAVVGKASMDDMARGKSCGACHNGKDAFASSGDCAKCHKGMKPTTITFKTDAGVATFSHEFHLQAYKCADCHTRVFPFKAGALKATMADMEKGKSCGACHNKDKEAFSVKDDKYCDKCHKM